MIALIQCGADPLRPPNKAGNTPLRDAERERHENVINFLKEYERRVGSVSGPISVDWDGGLLCGYAIETC